MKVSWRCGDCGADVNSTDIGKHVCVEQCTLTRVQREVAVWADLQFGNNPSHDTRYQVAGVGVNLHSLPPLLGMMEELGELCAPVCKRHQGRKFMNPIEYHDKVRDSLADLMIFMCDFARREGIDLAVELNEAWETVKKRRQASWEVDKSKESSVTNYTDDDERPVPDYRPEDERLPITQTSSGNAGREDLPDPPVAGGYTGATQTGQGWAEPADETKAKALRNDGWHIARVIAGWLDDAARQEADRFIGTQERNWFTAQGLPVPERDSVPTITAVTRS